MYRLCRCDVSLFVRNDVAQLRGAMMCCFRFAGRNVFSVKKVVFTLKRGNKWRFVCGKI